MIEIKKYPAPIREYRMNNKKNLWFSSPTQLLMKTQWPLIWKTHLSQTEQWWVLAGFKSLHWEHFLFQNPLRLPIVLVRYFISLFTSFWRPSNLSSSTMASAEPVLGASPVFTLTSFRFSLFLISFLSCSLSKRSLGPPGLITIAQKWLNTIL